MLFGKNFAYTLFFSYSRCTISWLPLLIEKFFNEFWWDSFWNRCIPGKTFFFRENWFKCFWSINKTSVIDHKFAKKIFTFFGKFQWLRNHENFIPRKNPFSLRFDLLVKSCTQQNYIYLITSTLAPIFSFIMGFSCVSIVDSMTVFWFHLWKGRLCWRRAQTI